MLVNLLCASREEWRSAGYGSQLITVDRQECLSYFVAEGAPGDARHNEARRPPLSDCTMLITPM